MLQVEHRIMLAAGGITGRSIYIDIFPLSINLRLIAHAAHLAVFHVGLQLVAVGLICWIRYLHAAGHHATAVERLACGVSHLHAVNHEEVIVEAFRLRFGSAGPHAVGPFLHVVELAKVYLHLLCRWSFHAKLHSAVLQHPWIFLIADIQSRGLRQLGLLHASLALEEVHHPLECIVIEGHRTMVAVGHGDEVVKTACVLQCL